MRAGVSHRIVFPLLAALAPASCRAPRAERFEILEPLVASLDEVLRAHPLDAEREFRSDEIHRTASASVHVVQVRGSVRPHYHRDRDEVVYCVRGEGVLTVVGEEHEVRPGRIVVVPRRHVHSFRSKGPETAVFLSVFAPPFEGGDRVFVD